MKRRSTQNSDGLYPRFRWPSMPDAERQEASCFCGVPREWRGSGRDETPNVSAYVANESDLPDIFLEEQK